MKNEGTDRTRTITDGIDKRTKMLFVVFVLGSAAAGMLAALVHATTEGEKATYITLAAMCMFAMAMLAMAVNYSANVVATSMKLRARELRLREGISGFIANGLLAIFALFAAYVAVSWGVESLLSSA